MKVKNDHRSKFSNLSNYKEQAWKKIRASTGFEPVTSALLVRCFTNWAMKPHIGSEVNLLSSYLPWGVKWYELNKLTSLPKCGFMAQLVKQRTSNAEVTGSNPVEALNFSRLLLSNCLNWKIYCDDHSSLSMFSKMVRNMVAAVFVTHFFRGYLGTYVYFHISSWKY